MGIKDVVPDGEQQNMFNEIKPPRRVRRFLKTKPRLVMKMTECLQVAHDELMCLLDDGVICPVCERLAKSNWKKFGPWTCLALIIMYKMNRIKPGLFIHKKKLLDYLPKAGQLHIGGGDFALARHWGLIENIITEFESPFDFAGDGEWRITGKGISFVENLIKIPVEVRIYNAKILKKPDGNDDGFSREYDDIIGMIGNVFNYREWFSAYLPDIINLVAIRNTKDKEEEEEREKMREERKKKKF